MAGSLGRGGSMNKFKISRHGRKLQISDDPRTLLVLPKDVPERTWVELFQKEENELICFEIREDIIEEALTIGYEHYMEKQNSIFTVHCAAAAFLKLIDWHFYRHDPGEEPSAYPPCYIPKRMESWTPDPIPDSSVKDSWGLRHLRVLEKPPEEVPPSCLASPQSIELHVEEPIPQEYWFPGRINLTTVYIGKEGVQKRHVMSEDYFLGLFDRVSELYSYDQYDDSEQTLDRYKDYSSEVLERITDYSSKDSIPASKESKHSSLKHTTPVNGSLQGAGDSTIDHAEDRRRSKKRKSSFKGPGQSLSVKGRLPPIVADSLSYVSKISDCRLRNLRVDAQYEIGSEKMENTSVAKINKKKV